MKLLFHSWRIGMPFPDNRPGLRLAGGLLGILTSISGLLAPPQSQAQTNVATESRYLLIFDLSSGMKRRSENVQRVAGDLIYSGMNGQMRAGDTIGVWTFNEALQAGNLPLLRWTPERRKGVASKVTEFLRAQKFEKSSRFDTVLPALERVVASSTKLTVLVFSDGLNPFSGTPFDAEINAAYKPFRETQKQERMPFVTVLRVKDQEYLGYAVTPSPWAVEFPKFPPEPVVVAPKVEPKPEPVRPVVPPLIVIGKKDTNVAPTDVLPQPGNEPKPEPKPGLTEAEKLFAKLAAEQGVELPPNFGSNSATVTTTAPASAQPTSVTAEQPKPVPVTEAPRSAPPPETKTAVSPVREPTSVPVATNAPAIEPGPAPAVQADVVPVDKQASRLLLLAGGASVLLVTFSVVYALLRRRRHRAHISLITRSMDHRNK